MILPATLPYARCLRLGRLPSLLAAPARHARRRRLSRGSRLRRRYRQQSPAAHAPSPLTRDTGHEGCSRLLTSRHTPHVNRRHVILRHRLRMAIRTTEAACYVACRYVSVVVGGGCRAGSGAAPPGRVACASASRHAIALLRCSTSACHLRPPPQPPPSPLPSTSSRPAPSPTFDCHMEAENRGGGMAPALPRDRQKQEM